MPIVGIVVSLIFTALFVARMDFDSIKAAPTRIDYRFVALAGMVYLLEFFLRAIRWRVLLAPVSRPSLRCLLEFTFIGFTANTLLPARAGELVKPALACRRLDIPFTPVLVTVLLERLFDVTGLLVLMGMMLVALWLGGGVESSAQVSGAIEYGLSAVRALGLVAIVTIALAAVYREATGRLIQHVVSWLPGRVGKVVGTLYEGVVNGMASFKSLRAPIIAFLISAAVWANGAIAIWVMAFAFDFDLPFAGACFVSLTLAFAVSVPQAPGFIGVWQVVVSEALVVWGASIGDAQAFALVFWLLNFGPASIIGLAAIWAQGLTIRSLLPDRHQAEVAP